jgi:hypothetical protein
VFADIHQTNGAVVLNQEIAGEDFHCWTAVLVESTDRQRRLMLLRFETFLAASPVKW